MKFARTGRDRSLIVEITPMIDVVFLLIIFFMTTAQFARETRAELDLPQQAGEQDEETEEAGLVVNITADGELIINGETLAFEDLQDMVETRLREYAPGEEGQMKLMLRADRNANTTVLNRVLNYLEGAGVGAARIATQVPN